MTIRKPPKHSCPVDPYILQDFFESQAMQLMGGILGIAVGIYGKDIVKKAFCSVVKASKKPGFWDAFDGALKHVQKESKTARSFKKLGKCFGQ